MKTKAEIYERSNSIETVDLSRFAKSYYKKLLNASETKTDRQKAASSLVDYLCNKYENEMVYCDELQEIFSEVTGMVIALIRIASN